MLSVYFENSFYTQDIEFIYLLEMYNAMWQYFYERNTN